MLVKYVLVSNYGPNWFAMENTAVEARELARSHPDCHVERWTYPVLDRGGHGEPTKERIPTPQPRRLTCAVCGSGCIGRQWWNRDTGYGLCPTCPEFVLKHGDAAELRDCYGVRGYHFDIPGTEGAGDYWYRQVHATSWVAYDGRQAIWETNERAELLAWLRARDIVAEHRPLTLARVV